MLKYVILFFLLFVNLVYADVFINEIMYNPEGDDNNNEYIEIILDSYINLTNYKIQDLSSEDSLQELKFVDNEFALIVEEGFSFNDINSSVYSVGTTIGNNLNNDNDIIIIKDSNDTILDTLSYNSNWGADGNNKSLCRIPDKTGIWQECTKTPSSSNSITEDFSNVIINEFLPNPIGDDNAAMPNGEWIELYNNGNNDLDLIGLELKDNANHKIIISDTNTLQGTIIKAKNYLVVYMNGFSGFLNNEDLELIKLYSNNILIDEVSYSNSGEGLSWSNIKGIWQISEQTPGGENKDNSTISNVLDSSIEIDKIYDLGSNDKAEWSSNIRVKLLIYKGDTDKHAIEAYIEGPETITKFSKTNVYDKFKNYTITLPIQIILNCDKKYEDGNYEIVVEGLDTKDTEKIKISGESKECKNINNTIIKEVIKKESIKKDNVEEKEMEIISNKLIGNVIYENTSREASRLNVFIFIILLIILSLVLLYERKNPG